MKFLDLKQRRWRRQRERQKAIGLHEQLSLPSLHDYDVKLPNFTLCGEHEYTRKRFSIFYMHIFNRYSILEFDSRRIRHRLTN